MFKTMKQLFTSTNKDLRHRIYFTLGALLIFILGTSITVPGAKEITKDLGILDLINAMGGGALKKYSIFALGVTPYITASIIIVAIGARNAETIAIVQGDFQNFFIMYS